MLSILVSIAMLFQILAVGLPEGHFINWTFLDFQEYLDNSILWTNEFACHLFPIDHSFNIINKIGHIIMILGTLHCIKIAAYFAKNITFLGKNNTLQ
jgi:hypothetical protein